MAARQFNEQDLEDQADLELTLECIGRGKSGMCVADSAVISSAVLDSIAQRPVSNGTFLSERSLSAAIDEVLGDIQPTQHDEGFSAADDEECTRCAVSVKSVSPLEATSSSDPPKTTSGNRQPDEAPGKVPSEVPVSAKATRKRPAAELGPRKLVSPASKSRCTEDGSRVMFSVPPGAGNVSIRTSGGPSTVTVKYHPSTYPMPAPYPTPPPHPPIMHGGPPAGPVHSFGPPSCPPKHSWFEEAPPSPAHHCFQSHMYPQPPPPPPQSLYRYPGYPCNYTNQDWSPNSTISHSPEPFAPSPTETFPSILFRLIQDTNRIARRKGGPPTVISFVDYGRAVQIHNPRGFFHNIAPLFFPSPYHHQPYYFHQDMLAHDFQIVEGKKWCYRHRFFQQQHALLHKIVRVAPLPPVSSHDGGVPITPSPPQGAY